MTAKGDFQISIGLLVTVIFAVVLLTLGIAFIRDIIGNISDISEDMQRQAQEQLNEQFKQTDKNFLISPLEKEVKPNTIISVTAGIKNNEPEPHQYVIGIKAEKVPAGVTKAAVDGWISYVESSKTVKSGELTSIPIKITIPNDAKKDIYFFRISSCYDKDGLLPSAANCNPNSQNLWATGQDFVLTVK
ncbi:MAG: hypothetical protein HYX24_05820 [Candidatus Aenigmarchaeota archaeon]|nr:hypothetical protein [Candidatus Aenigmarchaeota archaeon]